MDSPDHHELVEECLGFSVVDQALEKLLDCKSSRVEPELVDFVRGFLTTEMRLDSSCDKASGLLFPNFNPMFALPLGQNPPHLILHHNHTFLKFQMLLQFYSGPSSRILLYDDGGERPSDHDDPLTRPVTSVNTLGELGGLDFFVIDVKFLFVFRIDLPAHDFQIGRLLLSLNLINRLLFESNAHHLKLGLAHGGSLLLVHLSDDILLLQLVEAGRDAQPFVLDVVLSLCVLVVEGFQFVVIGLALELGVFVLFVSQFFGEVLLLDLAAGEHAALDPEGKVQGAVVEHFREPRGPLFAGWTEVDFNHPRIQFLVKDQVEAKNLEAILCLIDRGHLAFLHALQRSVHHVLDLGEKIPAPRELRLLIPVVLLELL